MKSSENSFPSYLLILPFWLLDRVESFERAAVFFDEVVVADDDVGMVRLGVSLVGGARNPDDGAEDCFLIGVEEASVPPKIDGMNLDIKEESSVGGGLSVSFLGLFFASPPNVSPLVFSSRSFSFFFGMETRIFCPSLML